MTSFHKTSALCGVAFVLIVLAFGVSRLDSPQTVRKQRFDSVRVNAVSSFVYGVEQFAMNTGRVPTSTDEMKIKREFDYVLLQTDPETGAPYEYFYSTSTFSVCAVFSLDTMQGAGESMYYGDPYSKFSRHTAGRYCFETAIPAKIATPVYPEGMKPLNVSSF